MSDAREPEPQARTLDISGDTSGDTWQARIEVWPYSGLRNEKVYTRRLFLTMRAADARAAMGIALSAAKIITLAHDVWQANVFSLERKS
jgi:hypothetical protein